jgi:hypothetical protein
MTIEGGSPSSSSSSEEEEEGDDEDADVEECEERVVDAMWAADEVENDETRWASTDAMADGRSSALVMSVDARMMDDVTESGGVIAIAKAMW